MFKQRLTFKTKFLAIPILNICGLIVLLFLFLDTYYSYRQDLLARGIIMETSYHFWQYLLVFVAISLFSAFFSMWFIRYHLKPLSDISQLIKVIISKKDYSLRFSKKGVRSREIEYLTTSLNRMLAETEKRDNKIKKHNEVMEQLVFERTRELEKIREKNIQAAKLVPLGEMASGIAHEINNPLAIISSTARVTERYLKDPVGNKEKIESSLKQIEKTTLRISKIIQSLRNLSRTPQEDSREDVVLEEIFEDIFSLCREKFRIHDIDLTLDASPEVMKSIIRCNRVQISQIFVNLLNNSFDALTDAQEKWVKLVIKNQGGFFEFNVIDSGLGIPQELQSKIMEPFFTTKDIGKGTGLGLSLSMTIIKNHNGEFYIDDKNPNTCFVIKLPQTEA